jgi:hypothetical protein
MYYKREKVWLKEIPSSPSNIFQLVNEKWDIIFRWSKRTFWRLLKREKENFYVETEKDE